MDNEVIATSSVKTSISITDYLSPYINEKDKEPIWDGNIYVYSDKNKSNKSCKGRVPVQVKSKVCNELPKDKITYPIRTDDLNKYLRDNGVVYFVVYINNDGKTKIYFNDLLPFKIKQLLEDIQEEKTKSIELKLFPINNEEKVDLFFNFLRDRELQKSISSIELMTVEELERMGQLKELSFGFTSTRTNLDSPLEYLFHNNVYLYATVPLGIKIPVDVMTEILFAKKQLNKQIAVNGTKYYDSYNVIHKKDVDEFCFGKSTVLILKKGTNEYKFNFKLNGELRQRINDGSFFIDMIENGSIDVDGVNIPIEVHNSKEFANFEYEKFKEHLIYLKNVRAALDKVGVIDDLDLDNLTIQDENHIRILVDAFVYNKEISFGNSVIEPIGKITVANLCIMLIARKKESGTYALYNFFNERIDVHVKLRKDNSKYFKTSQFTIMNKDNFLYISNIDYDAIYNDITTIEGNSTYYNQITLLILQMILAYDEGKSKDNKLLQITLKLSEWLLQSCNDVGDKSIELLNYLQTVKRCRVLNSEELEKVHSLIENRDVSDEILTAAYILLENLSGAKLHFDKLLPEEQEKFKKYPIYNLWVAK